MLLRRLSGVVLASVVACLCHFRIAEAQSVSIPTGDQLDQLVAPVALYPDPLLSQICAASEDPQQILDANNWLTLNKNLQGQALTDAAQKQGFDPAFISLVNFPEVLRMMAAHIDDYAALGAAFKASQTSVMDSVQRLRQKAYASGALDSNEYQNVSVQTQGGAQVVVVQPANPQVVYVPQYSPQVVYSSGPSTGDVVAASLISFGAGIALGAWINNNSYPWGWGGWGWGWGRGVMVWHSNPWVYRPIYRPPRPYYRPRPPIYRPPVWGRPPGNWYQRPGYRPPPPGWRPVGPGSPGRPPVGGTRPPVGGTRPPGGGGGGIRPPGSGGGNTRPPGQGGGATRPTRPGEGNPPGQGGRPSQPVTRPAPQPSTRPAPQPIARPAPQPGRQPSQGNPFAGHRGGQQITPAQQTGSRQGAFGGTNNGGATRAASDRGRMSAGAPRAGGKR